MKPKLSEIMRSVRSREQVEFDDSSLQYLLDWWQRALGLDAWSIEIRRARGFRMGGNYGSCKWCLAGRRAQIKLVHHEDLAPESDPQDDEVTIVHELLHIVFAALDDKLRPKGPEISDVEDAICVEQPIEWLSLLLVALRRAPRGDMP